MYIARDYVGRYDTTAHAKNHHHYPLSQCQGRWHPQFFVHRCSVVCSKQHIDRLCNVMYTHTCGYVFSGRDAVTFAKFMLMFKDSPAKPLYERRTYFALMSRSRWIFFAELQILSNIKVKLQPSTTASPSTECVVWLNAKVSSVSTYKHDFELCFVVVAGSWRWENFTYLMFIRLFGHNSRHPPQPSIVSLYGNASDLLLRFVLFSEITIWRARTVGADLVIKEKHQQQWWKTLAQEEPRDAIRDPRVRPGGSL